jgi:anti-sigma regulatory factor (Ser/Thr protein kinase)
MKGFVHQALIYDSDEEFMDVVMPFIEEGVIAKEPTLVAVQERHVENLRAALGGAPAGVTLFSTEQWYDTSARTREKYARWVAENTNGSDKDHRRMDTRARLVGEPPWAIGHEAQVRDWARYESVLNVAFAEYPVTLICPYDASALPADIIRHARSTHPEIVDAEETMPSESYEDPVEFCRRLDSFVSPPPGVPDAEISFGLADLPAVRRTIGSLTIDAGLVRTKADEMVLAVNEIATNAVVHGRSPAALRIWRTGGEIIFEVSDSGEGIKDVLAGQLTPDVAGPGGRGLWLTRLVADAVEIRNGTGCTVTIHAAAPVLSVAG